MHSKLYMFVYIQFYVYFIFDNCFGRIKLMIFCGRSSMIHWQQTILNCSKFLLVSANLFKGRMTIQISNSFYLEKNIKEVICY